MADRTTLRDIADRAGVSLTTVSQTLNNKGAISEPTRNKVMVAAEQLGYQQRLSRPRLNARLGTVTMLVKRDPDEKAPNPFHYYVMQGVEEQCRQFGLELRYSSLGVDENSRVLEFPSAADLRNSDGFLIVGAVVADGGAFLETLGARPAVFINGYLRGAAYDRVGIDNRAGAYDATLYLLERGHTHIGFVGGGVGVHPSIGERREGYLKALEDAALETYAYVADSIVLTPDYAAEAAEELLEARADITALVAASDNVAMGIYRAAETLGLQVPRDLSVMGFDNLHGVEHLSPALSTMNIDKEYLGAAAVRHLYDTSLPNRPNVSILVRPDLVARHSVSSPVQKASPHKVKGEP